MIRGVLVGAAFSLILGSLLACSREKPTDPGTSGSPGASFASSQAAPVTLKGMLFNEAPKDLPIILEEFEKRTKDKLNTKINLEWNTPTDHKQKVKLKMATGEAVDFMFDAPWMGIMYNMINQGAYAELDPYFNNDQYPGLKKAFSKELLDNNKINGHIYTIPIVDILKDVSVVVLRKDLREKYGLPPIKSYDDLKKFYDKVLENDKDLSPVSGMIGFSDFLETEFENPNVFTMSLTTGDDWFVALSPNGKKVEGLAIVGDPDTELAKFPAPYNTRDKLFENYYRYAEWSKYQPNDVLSQKIDNLWKAGKLASTGWLPVSLALQSEADLKKVLPNAETEIFILSSCARKFAKNCLQTDYRANNSIVIPAHSKYIDRTMAFFDWLFSSKENHDLFQYGIVGKHWEPVENDQYKELDQMDNYRFPGYEMTWNPTYFRMNAKASDEVKQILAYASKPESYKLKKLAGFIFNNEPVKLQLVQVQPKFEAFNEVAHAGLAGNGADFDTAAKKINDELRSLGLEQIRAELRKQIQEYLDKEVK